MKSKQSRVKNLAMDGLFAAVLVVAGMIKLPSIVPGAEFQLSAPYAVCLAVTVGFFRYLKIGIFASVLQLLLGGHTWLNVLIAMVFRLVAGALAGLFPKRKAVVCLAGPLGTAAARLVLAAVLTVSPVPLLIAAVPGMLFTAFGVCLLLPVMERLTKTGKGVEHGAV